MIINKDSWHYKAWRWTYDRAYQVPDNTNLCPYMRRIMFLVPIKALVRFVVATVSLTCLAIVAGIRWCFGYKTVSTDWDDSPVEYAGLPVAGRQLYPWHVLVPAAAIGLEALLAHSGGWVGFGIVNGIILGCAALTALGMWFFCSDSTEIFRTWADAAHRKVCPVIEFGDHYDAQMSDEEPAIEAHEEEEEPDTVDDLLNKAGSGPEETAIAPVVEALPAPAAVEPSKTDETK